MALLCTYLPSYLSNCRTKNRLGSPLLFHAFLSSRITSLSAVGLIFSLFMLQSETNADVAIGKQFKFLCLTSNSEMRIYIFLLGV